MTDHFEAWINSMSDDDYDFAYNEEFTEKQRSKALNIREPISEQEMILIERQQEGRIQISEVQPPEEPEVEIATSPSGDAIIAIDQKVPVEQPSRSIATKRERVRQALSKIASFFRRKK